MRLFQQHFAVILLFVWFGAGDALGQPPPQTLRWSLQEGQRLELYLVQTTTTRVGQPDRVQTYSTAAAMNLDWRIEQVRADGTAELSCRFLRFRYKVLDPPDAAPSYDTADSRSVPATYRQLDRSLQSLLATPVRLALSSRGQLTPLPATDSADQPPEQNPQLDSPASGLSEPQLVALLQQSLGRLPETPVVRDATWESRRAADSPFGELDIECRFTYRGKDLRVEQTRQAAPPDRMALDGRVRVKPDPAGPASSLGDSRMSGYLLFSAAEGRLYESQTTLRLSTTATVGDQELPVISESRLTLKMSTPKPTP